MSELPISGKVDVTVGERSVDKLIDAVVDTFSPATEVLGALGDAVRLGRVEMAARITVRAKQIADANGLRLLAPPLKFLVPYYERASLEEDDTELTELWAQLLVSSGSDPRNARPIYVDILSKMSASAALVFRDFCSDVEPDAALEPITHSARLRRAVAATLSLPNFGELLESQEHQDLYRFAASLPQRLSIDQTGYRGPSPELLTHMLRGGARYSSANQAAKRSDVSSTGTFKWRLSGEYELNSAISELIALGLLSEFTQFADIETGVYKQALRRTVVGVTVSYIGASFFFCCCQPQSI
ncbi:Abi-alpha family protein [Maricaulis sp.]|uniref:Abi-alpha family protein n=1 Tax=Maricaulis sp. TaxID=1486257 RepID=UPI003A93291B